MHEHLHTFVETINIFFLFFVAFYTLFLFFSVIYGAVKSEKHAKQNKFHRGIAMDHAANYIPISVLVPAYNEELTILDTVKSLCMLDYPEFEIIVIDDGSEDQTAKILIDELDLTKTDHPIRKQVYSQEAAEVYESLHSDIPITLVCKKNGGKGDALNMGINISRYPYFLSLDADSILQKDALKKLIVPILSDSSVIAVGGMVQVANEMIIENGEVKKFRFPHKFVVLMQMLEYSRTFMAMRMFLDAFNSNLIISGTCGLFRKDMVIQANGYKVDTVGEDMELVVKLHAYCRSRKVPYKIAYAPDAICWTQVPGRLKDMKTQRRRWQIGLIQSLYTHRMILFNPLYGATGVVSTLYYLMVEMLGPFIELLGIMVICLAAALEMINVSFMIGYFLLFYLLSAFVTITAFFTRIYVLRVPITINQAMKVIILSFLESFFFHHLVTFFRLTAFVNYKNVKMQWGRIQRSRHNRFDDE